LNGWPGMKASWITGGAIRHASNAGCVAHCNIRFSPT